MDSKGNGTRRTKGGLWIIPLYFRLDFSMRYFFWESVCDYRERGGEYANKLYFYSCNGKWLMDPQVSC